MTQKTIYLAGPEVFLPNAVEVGQLKQALCRRYGFVGLFPLDAELPSQGLADNPQSLGFAISAANEQLIRQADWVIANMTPFRGPSVDVGTAYELGFARGLGKLIHGYCYDIRPYAERVWEQSPPSQADHRTAGNLRDGQGLKIEEFQLHDNLMLEGGINQAGGMFVKLSSQQAQPLEDLSGFEYLLQQLAQQV